jgi:ABC-type branched-subunit amino acid transport system permease subunit
MVPLGYLGAALLLAGFPLLAPNPFFVHLGQTFAYTAIAVIGLNILLGLSGQMSWARPASTRSALTGPPSRRRR